MITEINLILYLGISTAAFTTANYKASSEIKVYQKAYVSVISSSESGIYVRGARLKDKIGNKKLININNKISKQLYDNVIVIQNLT